MNIGVVQGEYNSHSPTYWTFQCH